jgi:hypothetical protein
LLFAIFVYFCRPLAQVAELVDALDSKSSVLGRAGSIPALSTYYFCKRLIHNVMSKALLVWCRHGADNLMKLRWSPVFDILKNLNWIAVLWYSQD